MFLLYLKMFTIPYWVFSEDETEENIILKNYRNDLPNEESSTNWYVVKGKYNKYVLTLMPNRIEDQNVGCKTEFETKENEDDKKSGTIPNVSDDKNMNTFEAKTAFSTNET
eukprot:GFUD01008614.1.p2 GENE.GFUD01008614.1~~GFUD01008614.1.p2  ORF type:complete len:111 (+),score=32.99 GFUD01008614.1:199-531(+)